MLCKRQLGIVVTPKKRPKNMMAYERRFVDKSGSSDPYAYLESHSGEYDEYEKTLIFDPYADGWKWRQDRNLLSKWKPIRWMKADMKAETIRLFTLGFNDCMKLEKT
jgi:hypothetical protein